MGRTTNRARSGKQKEEARNAYPGQPLTPGQRAPARELLGAGDDHAGADREQVEEEGHGRVRDVHAAVARVSRGNLQWRGEGVE
jgi:hypothetical protein